MPLKFAVHIENKIAASIFAEINALNVFLM